MVKKFVVIAILFFSIAALTALNVTVDQNRFFDDEGNTRMELVYQVAYDQLVFERSQLGFEAELNVVIALERDGKEVYQKPFTNKIITHQFDKTQSKTLYKDKIVLTLSKSVFVTKLSFEDPRTEEVFEWSNPFEVLPAGNMITDIEISELVTKDTTNYRMNLHRNGMLFDVVADHVIPRNNERFVLYYELQNYSMNDDEMANLVETITISKDSVEVFTNSQELHDKKGYLLRLKSVDVSDLSEGLHYFTLKLEDKISGNTCVVKDWFVIKVASQNKMRIFTSLESEYKLIRYFVSTSTSIWKELDEQGKANLIEKFWYSNDPTPGTEKNEFYEIVKERVQVSNQRYKAFSEGWDTDMGRVYIRHGQPDEIIRENTGLLTKYAEKDYEIWKYRLNKQQTYLFIDIQNSNKYKMIYSDNDPKESSMAGWEDYLGEDFDAGILE